MDNNKDTIRLNTLKNIDPHLVSIVDCAMRTALYNYEQDSETWFKEDVEGTLMLYTREAPPYNMLIIINKLNKTNFIEPLTSACDLQVKPPYILFRNCKEAVYGIWFPDQNDVDRISAAMSARINSDHQTAPDSGHDVLSHPLLDPVARDGSPKGDIMSMLSHAHGVFESKKQDPPNVNVYSKPPGPSNEAERTTTNVADFFAKAGKSGIGVPGASLHSPSTSLSGTQSVSNSMTNNPVLQRLFQDAAAIGGQASVAGGPGVTPPISIPGASLPVHGSQIPICSGIPSSAPMSVEELEGKLKENLQIIPDTKDDPHFLKSPSSVSGASLLSPQVFTTAHNPLQKVDVIGSHLQQPSLFMPGTVNGLHESSQEGVSLTRKPSNITPLTKEQLVQAFSILLKRDDFVHQLHEAYVQALNQSIKRCL